MRAVIAPPGLDWAAVARRAVEALGISAGDNVHLGAHVSVTAQVRQTPRRDRDGPRDTANHAR